MRKKVVNAHTTATLLKFILASLFFKKWLLYGLLLTVAWLVFESSEHVYAPLGQILNYSEKTIYDQIASFELFPLLVFFMVLFLGVIISSTLTPNKFQNLSSVFPVSNLTVLVSQSLVFVIVFSSLIVLFSGLYFLTKYISAGLSWRYFPTICYAFLRSFGNNFYIGVAALTFLSFFSRKYIGIVVLTLMGYLLSSLSYYAESSQPLLSLFIFSYFPDNAYSEITHWGGRVYLLRSLLFNVYWIMVACLFLFIASVFMHRGDGLCLKDRLYMNKTNIKRHKFHFIACLAAIFVLFCVLQSFFPETAVLTHKRQDALYQERYKKCIFSPQPDIVGVRMFLDLEHRNIKASGEYVLKNLRSDNIKVFHVSIPSHPTLRISLEGHQLLINKPNTMAYDTACAFISITLDAPLLPNDSITMAFVINVEEDGQDIAERNHYMADDGLYITSRLICPIIAYDFSRDNNGTVATFETEKEKSFLSHRSFIDFSQTTKDIELTLSYPAGKTLIVDGQKKSSQRIADRYLSSYHLSRSTLFFGVFLGKYDTISAGNEDYEINLFHERKHRKAAKELLRAAVEIIDYCSSSFGKLPYKSFNIVEVHSLLKGGTCYQNTIKLSEDVFLPIFQIVHLLITVNY